MIQRVPLAHIGGLCICHVYCSSAIEYCVNDKRTTDNDSILYGVLVLLNPC